MDADCFRVERARHAAPALLLNPRADMSAEPFQGTDTRQQHLLGKKPGDSALYQEPRSVVARPAQRIEPTHQAKTVEWRVAEVLETVSLLDQSDMAPALAAAPVVVERRRGRLGELSGERIENHRRNCGCLRRKGADEPHGAKLRGKAETVMGAAQFGDDRLVALVEMEAAGDVVFAD